MYIWYDFDRQWLDSSACLILSFDCPVPTVNYLFYWFVAFWTEGFQCLGCQSVHVLRRLTNLLVVDQVFFSRMILNSF